MTSFTPLAFRDADLFPQCGPAEAVADAVWLVPVRLPDGSRWSLVVFDDDPRVMKPTRDEALAVAASQIRRFVGRRRQDRECAARAAVLRAKQAVCAHDFTEWTTIGRCFAERHCRKCGLYEQNDSTD